MPFNKLDKLDWWIISIYWMLAGPFIIFSAYSNCFSWETATLIFIINVIQYTTMAIVVVYWMVPTFFNRQKIGYFFLLLIVVLLLVTVFDFLVYPLLLPNNPPFSTYEFLNDFMIHGKQFGIIAAILVGKQYLQYQQKYLIAEKEKTAAELKLLKAQINPHFLFNNLNVLGALIQQDTGLATAYLKRFAALYRYLLSNKENDTVLLSEELAFIEDYIYLLKKRFGAAYDFQIQNTIENTNDVLVIPAAIQTLIENAVKHNRGDENNPLRIQILMDKNAIQVSNEIRPKFIKNIVSTGTGLENLSTRYAILNKKKIIINQTNKLFSVTIPLINNLKNL